MNSPKSHVFELYTDNSDSISLMVFPSILVSVYKNKLILMDNASYHRNQKVKDTIINNNNDYVYILPYQHGLNTIERFF